MKSIYTGEILFSNEKHSWRLEGTRFKNNIPAIVEFAKTNWYYNRRWFYKIDESQPISRSKIQIRVNIENMLK